MGNTVTFNQTLGFNIEDRVLWADQKQVIIGFGINEDNEILAHLCPQDIYEEYAPKNIKAYGEKYKNEFFPSHTYRIEVKMLYDHNSDHLKIKLSYNDVKRESYLLDSYDYDDPIDKPQVIDQLENQS